MGLTTRLMEQRSQTATLKDPAKWLVDWFGGATSATGVHVTAERAYGVAAVHCAIRILAETLAGLPAHVMKISPDGKRREKAVAHPLYPVLHTQPNRWQTSFEWREMTQGHLCLRGNAYSEIVTDRRGHVAELIPLHPDRMRVFDISQSGIGEHPLVYEYQPPSGPSRFLFMDEVLHLKGLSDDGLIGRSPIHDFLNSLGLAIGTDEYAARFFSNYANPGGVLTHPKTLSDPAVKRLRQQWDQRTGVEHAHKAVILEEGLTWTAMGVDPQKSQLIETRKFNIEEIARMFNLPVHKLKNLDRSTNNNIEHQAIEFVTDTMVPIVVRWEQRLGVALLTKEERQAGYFIKFNLDGLLRGDIKSRYEAYGIGRQWGWLNANDVLEREDMNPRDDAGGDAYHEPLNMQSSAQPPVDQSKKGAP